MAEPPKPKQGFFAYPAAVEAPAVVYDKTLDANPVFRGMALVIGAWIVSKLPFLQKLLWSNAHFNTLRGFKDLDKYTERWDPTVVPLAIDAAIPEPPVLEFFKALPRDSPGRYHSIADYHSLYLSGKLTPLAVVKSLLPLIRRDLNPQPKHAVAFTQSHAEEVIEAAKASTLRYQQGKPLSLIDGVPTAIKDDTKVAGYRTPSGRKMNEALFPVEEKSSWPVQNWQNAGGIVLGKLNMHELGCDTTNNNPNWGTPLNPHNDQYYPGGSSGGPAYAVSAGLIPFALGSDGGGSIRIPASFCGIYGLKPSHGRIEDTDSTVTVNGPLAASMSDLETAYRLMAVPNPSDPICCLFNPPRPAPSDRPKIIGVYKEWFERAEPSVFSICDQVLSYYENKLGYTVVQITIPHLPQGQLAHAMTILAKMAGRARTKPVSPSNYLSGLNPANKVLLGVGSQTPAEHYMAAQQLRNMLMCHLSFLYQKYPGMVIVTPTTPMPGWPIAQEVDLKYGCTDGNTSIRNMEYVWLANFCGNPALSAPVGYVDPVKGQGRVPVGIMGMGEWGSEDALIEWGRDAEKFITEEYSGGRARPRNWEDVIINAGGELV